MSKVYTLRLKKGEIVKEIPIEIKQGKCVDDIRKDVANKLEIDNVDPDCLVFIVNGQLLNRYTILSEIDEARLPENGVIYVFEKPFAHPLTTTEAESDSDDW